MASCWWERESFSTKQLINFFLLCVIHTGWHFSVVVIQLMYLLEDEAVLSSDKKNKISHLSSINLFGVRQLKHSRSCGRFSMHCLTWPKHCWKESHVSRVPLRTFRVWTQVLPSASSPVHLDCTTSVPAFPSASKDLLRHVRRKSVRGFLSLFAICR